MIELVAEVNAYGWSPAELHFQHPHLSMGQIHSALAYYWDHQPEIDQEIALRREEVALFRKNVESSAFLRGLRPT